MPTTAVEESESDTSTVEELVEMYLRAKNIRTGWWVLYVQHEHRTVYASFNPSPTKETHAHPTALSIVARVGVHRVEDGRPGAVDAAANAPRIVIPPGLQSN